MLCAAMPLMQGHRHLHCAASDSMLHVSSEVCRAAGTIALARTHSGREVRSAGWGPAFLDPGSGYDIGVRSLSVTSAQSIVWQFCSAFVCS